MFVEYWGVGAATPTSLPMTIQQVCGHLTADWVPSLPASVSSSFVGWPPFLLQLVRVEETEFLALRGEAERSDRQWKGVLSWMLGVAGARHLLESERYRWVAPLSAFYPNATGSVDLTGWNMSFPPSSVVVDRAPGSHSRLRPDYIALRPSVPQGNAPYEWAVAEAKGTCLSLANRSLCPTDWYNQARNVKVECNRVPQPIQRHLVIATRVNPKASYPQTRRIQLRAWNSEDDPARTALPIGAAVDVVAAHLFGFFRTLHLRENARALAISTLTRGLVRRSGIPSTEDLERAVARADEELRERTRIREQEGAKGETVIFIETDFGTIDVEIAAPTMTLARELQRSRNDDTAQAALREADSQLDRLFKTSTVRPQEAEQVRLSCGVRLLLPRDLMRL